MFPYTRVCESKLSACRCRHVCACMCVSVHVCESVSACVYVCVLLRVCTPTDALNSCQARPRARVFAPVACVCPRAHVFAQVRQAACHGAVEGSWNPRGGGYQQHADARPIQGHGCGMHAPCDAWTMRMEYGRAHLPKHNGAAEGDRGLRGDNHQGHCRAVLGHHVCNHRGMKAGGA